MRAYSKGKAGIVEGWNKVANALSKTEGACSLQGYADALPSEEYTAYNGFELEPGITGDGWRAHARPVLSPLAVGRSGPSQPRAGTDHCVECSRARGALRGGVQDPFE